MNEGDYRVAFAYKESEEGKKVSIVTGFFEVAREVRYERNVRPTDPKEPDAFVIEGRTLPGFRKFFAVWVPPIEHLLEKTKTKVLRFSVSKIDRKDFENVVKYVKRYYGRRILTENPFEREPVTEVEVVSTFVHNRDRLGVKKILNLGTRFPDSLVRLRSGSELYIEFERQKSNFWGHEHPSQLKKLKKKGIYKIDVIYWFAEPNDRRAIKGVRFRSLRDMLIDGSKLS